VNAQLKGYVVMLHHQEVGTFAPTFPNMDDAEEFSNAMRILTDDVSISEPVPIVASKHILLNDECTDGLNWDQALKDHLSNNSNNNNYK
jgi:uncharacterized protein YccT (UPF0319 family)